LDTHDNMGSHKKRESYGSLKQMCLNTKGSSPRASQRAQPHIDRRSGFTLVEIMVSATVSALLTVAVFSFYLTNYKIGFVNQERNRINANMRNLTASLVQDGRQSNYFVLYQSTGLEQRDEPTDQRLDGQSGDFLVFVNTSEDTVTTLQSSRIERVVAYYRVEAEAVSDGLSPVRRFERNYSPPSSLSIEELLPTELVLADADEVIELSRGLADGRLFYNFWGRSVMVNGQIFHGNKAKRVTETYNFTISPRG